MKEKLNGNRKVNNSNQLSLQMYQDGQSIAQIATERGLAESTINNHLAYYVATDVLQLSDFVSADRVRNVVDAIKADGRFKHLAPIKGLLPDDYTYSEIRMVLEHYKTHHDMYN